VHASVHADDDVGNEHHESGWNAFLYSFGHYVATTGPRGAARGGGLRPSRHQTPAP
jgi:hypothetical protein